MTARTVLALAADDHQAAVRHLERRTVDPIALLLAIHDATSPAELAAARLAAIRAIEHLGGYVWPDEPTNGCRVTTGTDALALGCPVDRDPTDPDDPEGPSGALDHVPHAGHVFHRRIAWLTARTESRLDGTDTTGDTAPRRTA